MDGDAAGKTMDKGASAASKATEMTDGIHEDAKQDLGGAPVGEKTTGATSLFSSEGAIGKQFTTGGMIGGTAQSIGGPLSADGAIGKNFTTQGSIGGMVQEQLGKGEKNTFQK